MTESQVPTRSLRITDPDHWEDEFFAFAKLLQEAGERVWFEVRWPSPKSLLPQEQLAWQERQESCYDAVELKDGVFCTLPPYSELITEETS
jgi:hypothetical protein